MEASLLGEMSSISIRTYRVRAGSADGSRSKRECRQQNGGEVCHTFCRLHIRFTRHFLPYHTLQRGTPARPRELPRAQSYGATARQGLSPQAPHASRRGKLAIRPKSCGSHCVHRRQPRDTSSFNARSSARTPKSGNAASLSVDSLSARSSRSVVDSISATADFTSTSMAPIISYFFITIP